MLGTVTAFAIGHRETEKNLCSESHKGEKVKKNKGTDLGVRSRQHIAVSGV